MEHKQNDPGSPPDELDALGKVILEEEEPFMALGIWDGFYAKMEALAEAEQQEMEEKTLESHLKEVRGFWDTFVMKLWPEDAAKGKPTFTQKLMFLNEMFPTSKIWKEFLLTRYPTLKQIAIVHAAYEKVAEENVLYPSHKKLIDKCKTLGLLK
jgi:hypothetical protein